MFCEPTGVIIASSNEKYISSLSKHFEKRFFERVIDTVILDVFFVYDFGQRGSLLCKKFQQLTV